MEFQYYPHDTQVCKLKVESSKYISVWTVGEESNTVSFQSTFYPPIVSYTTEDLLLKWDENFPLIVDEKIEFPQLELVSSETGDCTTKYTTGKRCTCLVVVAVKDCNEENILARRQLHLHGGYLHI